MRLTLSTALVLVAVSRGLRHGFDIIDATGLASGTVYPVLRRLEEAGLLRSKWEQAQLAHDQLRPPRRYYQITASGAGMVRDAIARYPGITRALAGAGTVKPVRS
ncbi:MAG: PadR family transcriptional regulator [Gemmatimonadota bacterium]|nr:PadR family transcriptional regulator [Gemmatimonadota bacterium]